MGIDIQRIINSRFSVGLASAIGRVFPARIGHVIADSVAKRIAANRDAATVRAVRANQWVIRSETLEKDDLDQAVLENIRNTARSLFDLYHYIWNPKAAWKLIVLSPAVQQLVQRPEFDRRGLIIVGLHMSAFDLILQLICKQGMKPLVLTIPDPKGGRLVEYEMRRKIGMNLIPASIGAMRGAIRHLQRGGAVLTGIDRPIPESGCQPRFFGRPASLPTHHIFMAVKAQVPVVIMVANLQEDGKYHVFTSDPIEMDPHPDREIEELRNAEKVLNIAEDFIRKAPQQWSMSLPVWPDVMDQVP